MKNTLKKVGKFAYNVKTSVPRAKARLISKGARAIGANKIADTAEKIAQPLNKGGMPKRNYKHGGKAQRSMYKDGGMPKAKPC